MSKKITYSSLALSSDTLLKLAPFLGRQATSSTSNTSVALAQNDAISDLFHSKKNYDCSQRKGDDDI